MMHPLHKSWPVLLMDDTEEIFIYTAVTHTKCKNPRDLLVHSYRRGQIPAHAFESSGQKGAAPPCGKSLSHSQTIRRKVTDLRESSKVYVLL